MLCVSFRKTEKKGVAHESRKYDGGGFVDHYAYFVVFLGALINT